tara:strand:+ start:284 stop:1075 length:792 start_codon:yes stop_codon:yes gene_type:complete
MARKDLLSEAIADAKAVKETALANAKLALEEAFTPKLQSMISAKLAEEMDDEDMDEGHYEGMHDDETEEGAHEGMHDDETEEGYHEEMEGAHEDDDDMDEAYHEEMDDNDEIDLDEVINALKEMAHEDEMEEMGHGKEEGMHEDDLEDELEEAYKTIESLQATINEVNLLNAKLLYTNKLFRTFDLNESHKVKVLENFDRTSSVREVKLVYATLAENLNVAKNKKVVKEGYASKTIKSSAPKKQIITETNNLASRWKTLAGLK